MSIAVAEAPTVSHRKSSTRTGAWRAAWLVNRRIYLAMTVLPLLVCAFLWLTLPDPHGMTPQHDSGSQAWDRLTIEVNQWWSFASPMMQGFPLAVAVFLGAVVTARPQETGSYRYLWTQGAGRSRLMAAMVMQASGLAALGALAIAVTYRHTYYELYAYIRTGLDGNPTSGFQYENFMRHVPVYTAFTAAAAGGGLLVGALIRRTVVAIATSAGAWLAAMLAVQLLFMPALRINPHELRVSNDPMMQLPATRQAMISLGLMSQDTSSNYDMYNSELQAWIVSSGFLQQDNSLAPNNALIDEVLLIKDSDGNPRLLEGEAYKVAAAKYFHTPMIVRYRLASDMPFYDWAATGIFTVAWMVFSAATLTRVRGRKMR